MHYYKFHIGDYASHTQHLEPLEDIAYRRMLDWCYLNESPLPNDLEEIGRLIRMRSHCDCIALVLREFFEVVDSGYIQARIVHEIEQFKNKSDKAKDSAKARWRDRYAVSAHANALRTLCENDANAMLTINHKPITNNQVKKTTTTRPTISDVAEYVETRTIKICPQSFIDYYSANGWKVGRNSMKDWKAAVRTWEKNENGNAKNTTGQHSHQGRLSAGDRTRQLREQREATLAARASDMGRMVDNA